MATWGYDDIEAGRARLWGAEKRITHSGSWGDPEEAHYELEGDEYWDESNDHNTYGRINHPAVAERIVACWNAFYGVPTSEIAARAPEEQTK